MEFAERIASAVDRAVVVADTVAEVGDWDYSNWKEPFHPLPLGLQQHLGEAEAADTAVEVVRLDCIRSWR